MKKTGEETIFETNEFSAIRDALSTSSQDSLVVFDVDEVLLTASDQVLRHKKYFNDEFSNQVAKNSLTESEIFNLISIFFSERKAKLVDVGFVDLIRDMQSKNIKTIALTNCSTGRIGKMPSMKDWRLNELNRLGYHFERSWKDTESKVFEHLATEIAGSAPVFEKGVLLTNGVSKGLVLKAFLDYQQYKPSKIIFIDDRMDYIESVREIARDASIPYLGIQFTAAENQMPNLNEKRAAFQLEVLFKEKKWLSDEDASLLLEGG